MNYSKILFFIFLTSFMFVACKNEKASENISMDETHQHSYKCPMDCEKGKTYPEPGRCPICGMELEEHHGEINMTAYKMAYISSPEKLEAGKAATMSFTPQMVGNEKDPVALEEVHTKKIHLIGVSEDLSYFEHIHPEYQADGSYLIKVLDKGKAYTHGAGHDETRFEHGGSYFFFADYLPSGGTHHVEKIALNVEGKVKSKVIFDQDKFVSMSDKYKVALTPTEGKLVSGSEVHITGVVTKDDKEVDMNAIENYLGAKAHMVVISLNEKEYLHVHPDVNGGKFELYTTFKNPGIYRGWIQFQIEGKVHTVDFTFNVKAGQVN
jgi:hypothetical protein